MTMPRRKNVDETKFLDEDNLYRAIKSNRLVKEYNLTLDEVKAVIRAYADIIYTCLKYDITVSLPTIGYFSKKIKKGFKGGNVRTIDEPFKKGSTTSEKYYPPKPDYGIITLNIKNIVAERFRKDTTLYGTEGNK
jgi:nucleoid DNA-binding protein